MHQKLDIFADIHKINQLLMSLHFFLLNWPLDVESKAIFLQKLKILVTAVENSMTTKSI